MFPPLLTAEFGGVFLLFLLFAVGAPLVLWSLIDLESEGERTEHGDWESAERAARRDTSDDDRY
ncbi:hypothetical protein [Haladaptatus sp. DFWS20]|uniref:hypothetical protein n=1 Tax=Haladaptatus sp. DFWS20 TaxID=3403467 RepID=UPI003EBD95BD